MNVKKVLFGMLVASTGVAIAGVAAYFSVFGISKVYAGAEFAVIMMASILEFGKLVVASILNQYWKKLSVLLKGYLITGLTILMMVTSAGIYGFLTNAYKKTSTEFNISNKGIAIIESKKARLVEQRDYIVGELKAVNKDITDKNASLSNMRNGRDTLVSQWSLNKRMNDTKNELNELISHRDKISPKIDALTDSIGKMETAVIELSQKNKAQAELGPLIYISDITGKSMDSVVNVFTLLIVLVFDPLAISLILVFNTIFKKKEDDDDTDMTPIITKEKEPKDKVVDEQKKTVIEEVETPAVEAVPINETTIVIDEFWEPTTGVTIDEHVDGPLFLSEHHMTDEQHVDDRANTILEQLTNIGSHLSKVDDMRNDIDSLRDAVTNSDINKDIASLKEDVDKIKSTDKLVDINKSIDDINEQLKNIPSVDVFIDSVSKDMISMKKDIVNMKNNDSTELTNDFTLIKEDFNYIKKLFNTIEKENGKKTNNASIMLELDSVKKQMNERDGVIDKLKDGVDEIYKKMPDAEEMKEDIKSNLKDEVVADVKEALSEELMDKLKDKISDLKDDLMDDIRNMKKNTNEIRLKS